MIGMFKKFIHWFGGIKKETYERDGIRPARDWYFMLVGSVILLGLSALLAGYIYILVSEGKIFASNKKGDQKVVNVNSELLGKIVNDIKTREENFQTNKTIPPDPSI